MKFIKNPEPELLVSGKIPSKTDEKATSDAIAKAKRRIKALKHKQAENRTSGR